MSSKKLKNVRAVEKLLSGEHKSQTRKVFGYNGNKPTDTEKRKVGDVWIEYDDNGNEVCKWEQRNGYRIKMQTYAPTMDEVHKERYAFPKCPKPECTCTNPTRLDLKFKNMSGMCMDCVIEEETKMKIRGTFNEYAINKIEENAKSFFKEADVEVNAIKQGLRDGVGYVNSDGSIEKWEASTDVEDITGRIDSEYTKLKEQVLSGISEQKEIYKGEK
jgi:hypothetical protein